MRCADAAEKVTRSHPELLQPYVGRLLGKVGAIDQHEVRWHVAATLPRVRLSAKQRDKAVRLLCGYLDDDSRIVRSNSIEGLAALAEQDNALRDRVADHKGTGTGVHAG